MSTSIHSDDSLQPATTASKLVSVICRTIDRPELKQAMQSVAEQSYSNIELVLVDALGTGIANYEDLCPGKPVKLVSLGEALRRSRAANAGMLSAAGDYLIFLDDDDWIDSEHIANLVRLLEQQTEARAAYSSTRKVNASGQPLDHVFDRDFDSALLRRDNFIPIHAVLFSASLLGDGCKFDETLSIYEDWDFRLQVSEHTAWLHDSRITAFYREGGESATAVNIEQIKYKKGHPNALARELVLAKWLPKWSAADVNQMLGTMDQSLAIGELRDDVRSAHAVIQAREQEIAEVTENFVDLQHEHKELVLGHTKLIKVLHENLQTLKNQHQRLTVQHEALDAGVREVLNSFSWRLTKPIRYIGRRLKYLAGLPKRNTVKVVLKNPVLHQTVRDVRAKIFDKKSNETSEDKFYFGLDSPNIDNGIFSESLSLRGWALSENDDLKLTAFVDGLEFRAFSPGLVRPDVIEVYPWLPHAASCGFDEQINLSFLDSGVHTLTLIAENAKGLREKLTQEFYLLKGKQLYSAWLQYKIRKDYQLSPATNSINNERLVQVVISEHKDIARNLASLNSLVAQDCDNWRVHYLGVNWHQVQQSLTPDSLGLLQSRTDVASDLHEILERGNAPQDYLLALDGGEQLQPNALRELLACAEANTSALVYSDHDYIDPDGDHVGPVFTFGWSPDHLMSRNYIGDVYLVRAADVPLDFLPHCELDGWRYALLLQMGNSNNRIDRVASMLWSAPLQSEAESELKLQSEYAVLETFLSHFEPGACLTALDGFRYIEWPINEDPLVSIIIPTMGKLELIKPCLDSLVKNTAYSNYEILMLDNSRGRYPEGIAYLQENNFKLIECDEEFNWARLNNIGARHSDAAYLLFLNDDIEVTDADWLVQMLRQAMRPDVGTVGSLLLYPNGAIQHAGVFMVNFGGGCAHLFHKMMPGDSIYRRLDKTVREVTASTGACLMVSREKFEAVGGFDEELSVVGNDIDLCLRLSATAYRNIWTPQCCLIHHESISRKTSLPKANELAMWKRWSTKFKAGDDYYNPNLSLEKPDCSLRLDMPPSELVAELLTDGQLQGPDASQSREFSLSPGVNLIAYIRAEMGVGEGARSDARALDAAAIDFGIINFETANPARMTDLSWQHKEMLSAPFDINLIHINANFLPLAKRELPTHFFEGRYNIAYWAWELEEIPSEWIAVFAEVDEVWVPSEFVKRAMEKQSPVPVVTIPHCVDLKLESAFSRDYFKIPDAAFTFLAMFDTHSIAERKNPYGAIKAFKIAFAGSDNSICLVLKVNNSEAADMNKLIESIQSHPNILIMAESHSRQEINALLSLSDCFVSLHRSEGFGLGPAEAMCLGKATILTNWSGSTDYMTADNCKAIDFELLKIRKTLGPYQAGQRWAEPDLEQAAAAMRELASYPELARSIGNSARQTIRQLFSPAAVGKKIAARLEIIRQL